MPIYMTETNGEKRLIKAPNVAAARNFVLRPLVPTIRALDSEEVANAMVAGVKLEDATAEASDPADADAGK